VDTSKLCWLNPEPNIATVRAANCTIFRTTQPEILPAGTFNPQALASGLPSSRQTDSWKSSQSRSADPDEVITIHVEDSYYMERFI